ncbi:SAC3 domain-containing protein 1 isoform X2 [Ixodes scapularis]|uniref:SAC3 domain-containing protein 1 isoform X2 n=1 Tax=Ixodes scapularis TaxID=6945 RepID=UPI001C38F43A|nr:SAC3 domain-containing protein 1 isoform X2 [Ixodes scapularis]
MAGVVGRCGDMCPRREREWREKERLLDPFEIVPGTEKQARPKADRDRAVKQFARSAAGQRQASPDELRPPDVLLRTTSYLLRTIVPSKEASWSSIYHFVWDRLWSVRQDMTVQGIRGTTCITVLEQAVRFYVYASFRSCQEGPNSGFDAHINGQHLQECLKRLLVLYCEMDWKTHPHQPEMEAIYLLHNLGSAEALAHAVSLPRCLRAVAEAVSIFNQGQKKTNESVVASLGYTVGSALIRRSIEKDGGRLHKANTVFLDSDSMKKQLPTRHRADTAQDYSPGLLSGQASLA